MNTWINILITKEEINMFELIVYLMILGLYAIFGLAIGILIQGIIYWTTGFSIWNYLMKKYVKGGVRNGQ